MTGEFEERFAASWRSISAARLIPAVELIAVTFCMVVGIWMQTRVHLNEDVAWITHSAGLMLEGRRFGSEIIDVNPPLIWLVTLPAAALAKAGLLSEVDALRFYVWTLCVGSILLCRHLLRPLRASGGRIEAAAILVAIVFAVAIGAQRSFGEREYLTFVLGMPYVLLMAARLGHHAAVPRSLAILVGVSAGIGFGFKPWLLAVPLLLEVYSVLKNRTLRGVFRTETVAMGCVLIAYVLVVVLFAQDYLKHTVPVATATYWAFAVPFKWIWATWSDLSPSLWVALGMLLLSRPLSPYAWTLLAAFVGFAVNFWAQGRGFYYHAYPLISVAGVLLAYAGVRAARQLLSGRFPARRPLLVASACTTSLLVMWFFHGYAGDARGWLKTYDTEIGRIGIFRQQLVRRVDQLAPPGSYFYAISPYPDPGFPTASYTRTRWVGAFCCHITAPAYARRDLIDDSEKIASINRAVTLHRAYVLDHFQRYQPRVVLVNTEFPRRRVRGRIVTFDLLEFMREDPGFAAIWRDYRELPRMNSVRLFIHEPQAATFAASPRKLE
jgi:hypothetical protein